jgi:hypothetical protein
MHRQPDEVAAGMGASPHVCTVAVPLPGAEHRPVLEAWAALGDIGDIADDGGSRCIAARARPDIKSSPRMSVSMATALVTPCTCAITEAVGTMVGCTRCSMPLSVRLRDAQKLDAVAQFGGGRMSACVIFEMPSR